MEDINFALAVADDYFPVDGNEQGPFSLFGVTVYGEKVFLGEFPTIEIVNARVSEELSDGEADESGHPHWEEFLIS